MSCLRKIAPLLAMLAVSGCGGDKSTRRVELSFAPRVGSALFSCTQSYTLGTSMTSVQPADYRLYVYDVALVRADGTKVPVALSTDGKYQAQNVALLDFEDNTGSCAGGTSDTNFKVVGSVEEGDYTGLHFRIGVPTELNHLDAAKQPAPLNVESMFWSWQDGHILMAVEWKTPINGGWQFRVAESTYESDDGCKGSHTTGYTCPNAFQPIVDLAAFDDTKDTVKLDLAPFFTQIDFARTDFTPYTPTLPPPNTPGNATIDYQPGCHTDEYDAECEPMFQVLGIDYQARSMPDSSKQTFASKL